MGFGRSCTLTELSQRAKPLLKFENGKPYLHTSGLNAISEIPGLIYPVILIGDGRAGKSYLASRILNLEGVFVSTDSPASVTEGVDVVVAPLRGLVPAAEEGCADTAQDLHLVLMDCEGGNNAMSTLRTLVNLLGSLIGSEVIFVAGGSLSESSLTSLSMALAARSLVQMGAEAALPTQRLVFVVNKNTLRYESDALEMALHAVQGDVGRKENRDLILRAFAERSFCSIGLMGMPQFEDDIDTFRSLVLSHGRAFKVGGAPVRSAELVAMLQAIVDQIQTMNEVSLPSMSRIVVMDGFLSPLVDGLVKSMQDELPDLEEYDANLEDKDLRHGKLAEFDRQTSCLTERGLVAESRAFLEAQLDADWARRLRFNAALGDQVHEKADETRDVITQKRWVPIGGNSLLASVNLLMHTVQVEVRSRIVLKKGSTEYTPWAPLHSHEERVADPIFQSLRWAVPTLSGSLLKQSPSVWRKLGASCSMSWQSRTCVVKEGHFLWWDPATVTNKGQEVAGAINFLLNAAKVAIDFEDPDVFEIRPASDVKGWESCDAFTGGPLRSFRFSVAKSEHSRATWVQALTANTTWANDAAKHLGRLRLQVEVSSDRPAKGMAEGNIQWDTIMCQEDPGDPEDK